MTTSAKKSPSKAIWEMEDLSVYDFKALPWSQKRVLIRRHYGWGIKPLCPKCGGNYFENTPKGEFLRFIQAAGEKIAAEYEFRETFLVKRANIWPTSR